MITPEISVHELQNMLEDGAELTILDIRPQAQRDEWKIVNSIHEDVYKELVNGNNKALDNLDLKKEVPLIIICEGGNLSRKATDILNEKGYKAYSLKGGMKAWNYAWNTAEIINNDLTIIQVRRVAKGCISYILASENEAVVVDASLDPNVYIHLADKNGWVIKYVMDTHTHADYISRTIELAKASGAKHYFTEKADVDYSFYPLQDGEEIIFGKYQLKAIHTPGHTHDSISYFIDNKYLLTGDTLFIDGVGRPDLKADEEQTIQKANQIYTSIEKIKCLEGDPIILPAHTTQSIDFNKKLIADDLSNLLEKIDLLKLSQTDFVEQTLKRIPSTPANYIKIANFNKKGDYIGFNPSDLEAGANRCAVA